MFWSFVISLLLIIETSSLVDNNDLGENKPIVEAQNAHVTVTSGQKTILTCIFSGVNHELSLSSSHQLIWIRQSYEAQNADSILAHNQDLLISDPRLTIQRTDSDYSLTITNVNIDDEGFYACEVNTQPPQKALVHLYVREQNVYSAIYPQNKEIFLTNSLELFNQQRNIQAILGK
ncbi:unnamed protein product [Rotaria socialis]